MYEPVKFKRLKEIATQLSTKLIELSEGKLSKHELENLTEESRELYERLVVLRFKAFEDQIASDTAPAIEVEKTEEPMEEKAPTPSFSFRLDHEEKQDTSGQVSLIDAIEEVAKEVETVAINPEHAVAQNNALNEYVQQNNRENFYEKLSKTIEQKETLNNKMEHTSIADLKRAISLNQRFQFSKELFKGNNQEYEVAIEKLNTTTREEALKQIENLKSKYEWNAASPTATDFVDLVERRYL